MKDLRTTIVGVLGLASTVSFLFFRKELTPEMIELLATGLTGILSVGFIFARDAKPHSNGVEVAPPQVEPLPEIEHFEREEKIQKQRKARAERSKMEKVK